MQQVERDLRRAVDLVNGVNTPPQINEQEWIFAQLLGVWQRADAQTKAWFCDYLAGERGGGVGTKMHGSQQPVFPCREPVA